MVQDKGFPELVGVRIIMQTLLKNFGNVVELLLNFRSLQFACLLCYRNPVNGLDFINLCALKHANRFVLLYHNKKGNIFDHLDPQNRVECLACIYLFFKYKIFYLFLSITQKLLSWSHKISSGIFSYPPICTEPPNCFLLSLRNMASFWIIN